MVEGDPVRLVTEDAEQPVLVQEGGVVGMAEKEGAPLTTGCLQPAGQRPRRESECAG